jgi:hypothetical protein
VAPPSIEYSIFTFPTVPVVAQVMACDDPTVQLSPPLGDVTVMVAVGTWAAIVNETSLASEGIPVETSPTRTRQFPDTVLGTVQV